MNRVLSLESLHELEDGRLSAAFNRALAVVRADLKDRCGMDAKRKISVNLEFKPVTLSNDLEQVSVVASVQHNIPKVGSSAPVALKVRGQDLVFSVDADHPDQTTLQDMRQNPGEPPKE